MNEEKKAREGMFGYVEVYSPQRIVIDMPSPYLIKMLTSRKRSRGEEIVREFQKEVANVVKEIKARLGATKIDQQILQSFIDQELKNMKPEYHDEVKNRQDLLECAAAVGLLPGKLDPTHVGLNPPVALGAHKRALGGLCEHFFSESDEVTEVVSSFCEVIAESAFYTSRRSSVQVQAGG